MTKEELKYLLHALIDSCDEEQRVDFGTPEKAEEAQRTIRDLNLLCGWGFKTHLTGSTLEITYAGPN